MDDNITLRAVVIVEDPPQCNYQNIIVRGRIHNILYYGDHAYHQRKDESASERVGELTAEGERKPAMYNNIIMVRSDW